MRAYPDERGHPMTASGAEAAAALDSAIHQFVHYRAAFMPAVKSALAADPEFGLAHAVLGLILHGARNDGFRGKVAGELAAARAAEAAMTPRERLYVNALGAAAEGRLAESVAAYETLLEDHPTDLLAQRLAQMELFWLGEMRWSAEISARAHPHWDEAVPGYAMHLSCLAFDLEEMHHYEEAERLARRAVELDPTDVWGAHAGAHVLIMEGRYEEGVAWLDGLKEHWAEANQMALHLWWHRCLFHLERGEREEVLAIYDQWVRNRELEILKAMPDLYIDLQNGASLLLRLELAGVDVGDRWEELAELTLARLDDHTSPFTSLHYAVILSATGRLEEAQALIDSMREFARDDAGTLGPRYAAAAIGAAEAAVAHRKGEHQQVVEEMIQVRKTLWQTGGSDAQRDLFGLLFADSARALGRADLVKMALNDAAAAGFVGAETRLGYRAAAALL